MTSTTEMPHQERKPIPQNVVDSLRRPLPKEAIKPHPTKAHLSTIKTIYSIERLNEVFGINGWYDHYEVVTVSAPKPYTTKDGKEKMTNPMVVVRGELNIPEYEIRREAFGGNDNEDLGDAYKGACTDALSKMVASLYIGMDVYKGNPNAAPSPVVPSAAPTPQTQAATAPVERQQPAAAPASSGEHRKPNTSTKPITEPQQKRLFAIAKGQNASVEDVKKVVKLCGYEHSAEIKMCDYEAICELFTSGRWADKLEEAATQMPPKESTTITDADLPF